MLRGVIIPYEESGSCIDWVLRKWGFDFTAISSAIEGNRGGAALDAFVWLGELSCHRVVQYMSIRLAVVRALERSDLVDRRVFCALDSGNL